MKDKYIQPTEFNEVLSEVVETEHNKDEDFWFTGSPASNFKDLFSSAPVRVVSIDFKKKVEEGRKVIINR
ncbi:MAG TPA: hypothetical protein VG738_14025 [Chitinophagaceae bacterium]|nr:hypothetical protein [Chitinophagaceae bacterium]